MEINEHIQGILDTAPLKPGCYLMKDADGKVIYVGKAINLHNRLRSYFHESAQEYRKTRKLVQPHRRYRVDRGRLRARSLDPRDEPDQEIPPALQRPPEG